MDGAYAHHYLGSRRLKFLALLHFLWRGERLGHRANPFLDPALHNKGERVRLGAYCRQRRHWKLRPSADFDPDFFASRHMDAGSTGHPFVHFWRHGVRAGYRPAADFDIDFFNKAVAVFRGDKLEFAFERMAGDGADFPRNEAVLLARQAAFHADITVQVDKDEPAGFDTLVFIQCAGSFEVCHARDSRMFDLLLNVYDGGEVRDADQADIVVRQNGTKTTAIRTLLLRAPELLLRYKAVFFLDDDVEIGATDIERTFAALFANGLDLAQPSLTADSACAFPALKQPQAGTGVRPISAIEIMAPIISRRVLETCGDTFGECISGWGVDALLSARVRERFGETIALIADVVAAHRREIDLEQGAFYSYLRRYGIEPQHEMGRLAMRFGIGTQPDAVRFLDGVEPDLRLGPLV